jgi:hypothetical protein
MDLWKRAACRRADPLAIANLKARQPGREMGTEGCLRWLIDKWLTPAAGRTVRLTRYSYPGTSHHRCIRIESSRAAGPFELFFFRHDDGRWRVFAPERAP